MNEHDRRIIHSSEDPNWRTPPACYVELAREHHFMWDLAADGRSCLAPTKWLGPGSSYGEDALQLLWAELLREEAGFLNPPFSRALANKLAKEKDPRAEWYRIENWARKCWEESQRGCTIVGLFPFAPQTEWYRRYVYGHGDLDLQRAGPHFGVQWLGHAAKEERRLPHRISYLTAAGEKSGNAGVNTAVIVWGPMRGAVGPWQPASWYWSYR